MLAAAEGRVGLGACFSLLVGAVGDVLEGETKRGFVVAALEELSSLLAESLHALDLDGGELRVEELGGEGIVRIEGIDVDEAVVNGGHGGGCSVVVDAGSCLRCCWPGAVGQGS